MIRAVFMSGRWLGVEIDSVDEDKEIIEAFLSTGKVVILAHSEEELEDLGINVEMV